MKKKTLYVDADACPVKNEIREVVRGFHFQPVFVASYAAFQHEDRSDETWIYVDQEKEAADLYILNHAQPGDAAVTQDMGLASLLHARGVSVLSVRGREINEQDVPQLLYGRYLAYKLRSAGRKVKGPRPFTDLYRKKFSNALTNLLCRLDH